MKFCPVCQTKYDEDIIKFCTKDGTPLVTENPSFTALPSQASIDDIGEETLIGQKKPIIPPPVSAQSSQAGQRIVIPTAEEKKQEVRPLDKPLHQQQPPRKSNTGLVVFLTIFGTIFVLGGGVGIWYILHSMNSNKGSSNKNTNINSNSLGNNTNYNSININSGNIYTPNSNTSTNTNVNSNTNVNANKTPSPTKTPTPSPSPTIDQNLNINAGKIVNISPSNTNSATNNRPGETPRPSQTPSTSPQNVNVGVMNSRASNLVSPAYPPIARQANASGEVEVAVSIDEEGNVLSARAISGHMLLRAPAEAAARQSRFNPVKMGDRAVRANGILVYNFINK